MYDFDKPFDRRGTNCWKWDGEGKGVKLAMGCADTDFRIAEPIAQALHRKIDEGALTYPVNNDKTRIAYVGYCKRHYNLDLEPEWICDSVGMMNGLRLILEAWTHLGDSVIIQSPVFNYFNDTVENAGRHILDNHMNYDRKKGTYSINFEELERMAQKPEASMMLISNPINPTSRAYTLEELLKISEICLSNHVILISDEVHADFYYDGRKHISILSLPDKYRNNSVMMTAPGKTFNTHGLYTAFHIIPNPKLRGKYMREYKVRHMDYMDLGMIAAEAAYSQCDAYVEKMQEYITRNLKYLKDFLHKNPIGIRLPMIEATYLIWLDFGDWGKTGDEIAQLLREYGLTLSSGAQYGYGAEAFMRMDIATQRRNVEEALQILSRVYREKIQPADRD